MSMGTKFLCPLRLPVDSKVKSFKLERFTIRRINDNDRKNLFGIENARFNKNGDIEFCSTTNEYFFKWGNVTAFLKELEIYKMHSSNFVIELVSEECIADISTLLLAFRLSVEGDIFAPVVFNSNTPALYSTGIPSFCRFNAVETINKSDLKKIKDTYRLIKRIRKDSSIYIALERFKYAINKETDQRSSFIEMVSILESIFLDNETNELSFRFSIITSFILKNKLKEKEASFNLMKKMYKIRSNFVHSGRSRSFTKSDLSLIQNYTSKLIVWHLKNSSNYEGIQLEIFKRLKV